MGPILTRIQWNRFQFPISVLGLIPSPPGHWSGEGVLLIGCCGRLFYWIGCLYFSCNNKDLISRIILLVSSASLTLEGKSMKKEKKLSDFQGFITDHQLRSQSLLLCCKVSSSSSEGGTEIGPPVDECKSRCNFCIEMVLEEVPGTSLPHPIRTFQDSSVPSFN